MLFRSPLLNYSTLTLLTDYGLLKLSSFLSCSFSSLLFTLSDLLSDNDLTGLGMEFKYNFNNSKLIACICDTRNMFQKLPQEIFHFSVSFAVFRKKSCGIHRCELQIDCNDRSILDYGRVIVGYNRGDCSNLRAPVG